ncbi:YqcC family protein [Agarivorans aestuarii]|uniref:YqcC family protein n=1 Tax=Agarivorans aestuarii TaxID=1563703 RepID=A0ABU7G8P2_9ALTE|nr:YqcC family protein [Agarivorans aestuarii]MEE1675626.1 YqcC family protein [Agarivorans aestuarii]
MPQSHLQLLLELEQCLKQTNNWQNTTPSNEQLTSSQPFCIDTLTLPQWLQFIFIPKMREMIQQGASLPSKIDISPYAEEVFKPLVSDLEPLLSIIKAIDESFNQ